MRDVTASEWTPLQRHSTMALLCIVGIFSLVDRQVLSILLEPIKQEFGASDTEMGLLTGSVFALFYALSSIPLARIADTRPRSLIIGATLFCWSLLTALGGLAGSITQLAITRMGVAIGEAGSLPAAYSVITDLYPLRHRAKAFSVFTASTSVGIGMAVILGGWLVGNIGWRMTLIAMGLPGVILALLIFVLLREPQRGMADGLSAEQADKGYGFYETLRHLWCVRSFPFVVLVCGFGGSTGYGLLAWGPSFLVRAHGMSPHDVGIYFGIVSIVSLVMGQLVTGVLIDIAARYDLRAYMWFAGGGCLLAIPFGLVFTLADDWRIAIAGFGMLSFFIGPHNMCGVVIAQTLAPPRMRSSAAMIMGLATALLGTGLAPLFIGGLNDALQPYAGVLAIRYSLSAALAFLLLSAGSAFIAARFVRADHDRLHREPILTDG